MNKPYSRDEIEQKQDYEGAKRDYAKAEADRRDDQTHEKAKGGDEEE